jgi:hypothetical protein
MRVSLRPAFITPRYWTAKRSAILIGFVLTVLGSIGGQFYVQPAQDLSGELDEQARDLVTKIDTLKTAQSQYILFQQQGALVQALNASGFGAEGSQQRVTLNNLAQLTLLNQSSALRPILGELAMARLLNYRESADKYSALIAAARKSFTVEAFTAVDDFEKNVMQQGQALMARNQQALVAANQAKSEADQTAERRKLQLLIVLTLGSTTLLAANLISTKEEPPPAPPPPAAHELDAAAHLIEVAIAEANRRAVSPTAPEDAPPSPRTPSPG